LSHICILSGQNDLTSDIASQLAREGHVVDIIGVNDGFVRQVREKHYDLVLLGIDHRPSLSRVSELSKQIKKEIALPLMALVSRDALERLEGRLPLDDFVITPCDIRELLLRMARLLQSNQARDEGKIIAGGGLTVNLAKCEVTLGGKTIPLTYREYELLSFLMSYRGRVFSREELLNSVWGYDYYGGDRTVDVHIRRLRSKLENPHQVFIETVRNIGYRFREDS
jgi:DNA-binding response OmpR family regulator